MDELFTVGFFIYFGCHTPVKQSLALFSPALHIQSGGSSSKNLGGLRVALEVLQETEKPNYDEFFSSCAVSWRTILNEEYLKYVLKIDCHALPKYRVNQVVKQFEEFQETYDVEEGDAMYLAQEKRRRIW